MKLIKYLYYAFDDKRYVLDYGVDTLAYFHKGSNKCDKINDNKDNEDNKD